MSVSTCFKASNKTPEASEPSDPDSEQSTADTDVAEMLVKSELGEKARLATETSPLLKLEGHGSDMKHKLVISTYVPALGNLEQSFGYKLLVMLFTSQHLLKGFGLAFVSPTITFLLGSYKVTGPQMQIYLGVIGMPWAMKPVIGLISDVMPICGYNKAPYIIISSICSAVACSVIAFTPHDSNGISHIVICLFIIHLQFSTCDLLTEAKYAESMQDYPQQGPALVSYVWFGLVTGGLVATASVGPIMRHHGLQVPYMILILPICMIIAPVAMGYMKETYQTVEQIEEKRQQLRKQSEACFLCLLMFAGTIVLSVIGLKYRDPWLNAISSLTVAFIMLVAFSIVLRPTIAKVNAFFLIQTSMGISIGGASFYFYTDTPEQYPDGPHFSIEFYTSVLGVAGSLCSMYGIYTYQKYASTWTYRSLLLTANLVLSVLSVSDVILFTRFNKQLGVPDHFFVLGASVLQAMVAQWMWMPGVVILSQLCPKGMEATMYALLAGCHNLGNTVAASVGAMVLQALDVKPSGAPDEGDMFKYLWVGSVLSTVMPLMTLLLIPYLIPDARQTDKLFTGSDAHDATAGSLWRRWRST